HPIGIVAEEFIVTGRTRHVFRSPAHFHQVSLSTVKHRAVRPFCLVPCHTLSHSYALCVEPRDRDLARKGEATRPLSMWKGGLVNSSGRPSTFFAARRRWGSGAAPAAAPPPVPLRAPESANPCMRPPPGFPAPKDEGDDR